MFENNKIMWCLSKIEYRKWNRHQPQAQQQFIFLYLCVFPGGWRPYPCCFRWTRARCWHCSCHAMLSTTPQPGNRNPVCSCAGVFYVFLFKKHVQIQTMSFWCSQLHLQLGQLLGVSSHVRNLCCMLTLTFIVYRYCSSKIHKFNHFELTGNDRTKHWTSIGLTSGVN